MDHEYRCMLNSLLLHIITDLLEQKPKTIPHLARRILPMLSNENLSDEKRCEIVTRIYNEYFPEDT